MPRLGAHMSIAGGLPCAIDRARAAGCEAVQIFTKSAGQWRARPLPAAEIAEFRRKMASSGISPGVAHTSYLINVGSSNRLLRDQSVAALLEELDRAEALGLMGLVMHPGAYTSGGEDEGLRLIGESLRDVLTARRRGRVRLLLEHTAGQGTSLGHRFEHLAAIIQEAGGSRRIGVCLDTCHLIAAGYDIVSEAGYRQTFEQFDRTVGLDRLHVLHLNDSKKPCGSRVDRHEHIGQGCLGLEPFRRLLNDRRFQEMPMLLETPKSASAERKPQAVDPLDAMNLKALKRLMERRPPQKSPLRT